MEKTLNLFALGDKLGRLDLFVSEKAKISRTQAHKLINEGLVVCNEESNLKPSTKLKEGDIIFVRIPMEKISKGSLKIEKENIPIDIIYEDDDIIVINKERGMVVHPAAGHSEGTLVNALLYHADEIEDVGETERAGIVHRLDKNTSGLLVAAKSPQSHQKLLLMFKNREITKEYLTIVHGRLRGREGVINLPIGRDPKDRKKMAVIPGGKPSTTHWKLIKAYKQHSLISILLETGRTHQIRVHLSYLGNPVVGDPEYGRNEDPNISITGQALHSHRLAFSHPVTGEPLSFTAPLPQDMEDIIENLELDE